MPTSYNFSAIPLELRNLKQWILWKYEDKGGVKPTKVPYSQSGSLASVTNPSDWCDFTTAFNTYNLGSYDGLGFVFTENDPYAFIDLDHTTDRADYERQLRVSREFNSYSEVSPSEQGLHIIIKGSIPQGRKRSSIEIYSSGRYATMTGKVYEDKPIADRHELLNQLFLQMGGPAQTNSTVDEPERDSDDRIIEIASTAANSQKFLDLFGGNWNNYYPSQSEADLALIDIIAFYTQNRNQIIRIFRKSALGKRQKATRVDYIAWMINKSFDRLGPKLDFDGWKINLDKQLAASSNGKTAAFDAEDVGSNPAAVANDSQLNLPLGAVAQRSEPFAHNGLVAGSNPASPTNNASVAQGIEHQPSKPVVVGSTPTGSANILPPPGLVGEIAQFIYAAAPRQVPEIAIAGAMGLMAGICGKAYNVSGTGLNQYILLLANTGSGKEAIAYGIDKIINAVQMSVPVASEFVGPSEIQSGPALIKDLAERASYVSILGEFGLRLRQLSNERANGAEISLRRMILDLYHKSGYGQTVRPTIYSDKSKNVAAISAPAFSIVGESTPERFYDILNEEMISEGLLPRFMIIEYNGARPPSNTNSASAQPSIALVEKIAQLMANAKTVMANRKVINVNYSSEADRMLKDFDKLADNRINSTDKEILRHLWNRAHLKALKISALIACGQNMFNPIIDVEAASWAINVVMHDIHTLSDKFMSGVVGKSSEETKQADDLTKMIRFFVSEPWEKVKPYFVDERFYHARIIPYAYLSRRLLSMASYRNDRLGATTALKRTLQTMIDSDLIREAGKKELAEKLGTTQRAFMITNMKVF